MAISIESDIEETAKRVYKELGAGHQEVTYREAMSIELQDRGYMVKTEMPVGIKYTTKTGKVVIVGDSRADLCIEKSGEKAIIELKTVAPLLKRDKDGKERKVDIKELLQLQKYLEALSEKKGFLINFPFPPRREPEIIHEKS